MDKPVLRAVNAPAQREKTCVVQIAQKCVIAVINLRAYS
jgi:hypothetical protein